MKSWRKRVPYGLAVAAAVVAIPLTAGSASAASWHNVAGGPVFYPTMAACKADIPEAKKHYKDATCVENKGRFDLWALY
ncbi:hypothetical protein [Streptomyces tsukubensis]|uniref:Secreted protein n=1 Tax=Streptomyces tsukubensis TaxID=83656 RepID=A0A1V4A2L5_9ACTN|nr:hypothetical protein [Streptomyces tsukubensis]OON72909.1 hypothetical protein B1H18_28280 [Streptomyces tsukubensis]QFR94489.1 hypothetical protein GBW32_17350 [Streptomyces tsukubensis]